MIHNSATCGTVGRARRSARYCCWTSSPPATGMPIARGRLHRGVGAQPVAAAAVAAFGAVGRAGCPAAGARRRLRSAGGAGRGRGWHGRRGRGRQRRTAQRLAQAPEPARPTPGRRLRVKSKIAVDIAVPSRCRCGLAVPAAEKSRPCCLESTAKPPGRAGLARAYRRACARASSASREKFSAPARRPACIAPGERLPGRRMTDDEVLAEFRASEALLEGPFRALLRPPQRALSAMRARADEPRARRPAGAARWRRSCRARCSSQIEVVVSPAMGGIIIGHEMGRALGVDALFLERPEGTFELRRGFRLEPGAQGAHGRGRRHHRPVQPRGDRRGETRGRRGDRRGRARRPLQRLGRSRRAVLPADRRSTSRLMPRTKCRPSSPPFP